MIIEIRAQNCFAFQDEIVFSMKADMHNKRLADNVARIGRFNVLKTAGIYGANNAGKTNLIKCIFAIWNTLENKGFPILFDDICCFTHSILCCKVSQRVNIHTIIIFTHKPDLYFAE